MLEFYWTKIHEEKFEKIHNCQPATHNDMRLNMWARITDQNFVYSFKTVPSNNWHKGLF